MEKFKDTRGAEWVLRFTTGTAIRIKRELDVDLLHPEAGGEDEARRLFSGILDDPETFARVIWFMIEEANREAVGTIDDLYEIFDGATIRAATDAFWREIAYFFAESGRPHRARITEATRDLMTKAIQKADAKIEQLVAETDWDERIDATFSAIDSSSFGNGEGSSD